jgi:membrane protease YdiL (CAAX protease family)
VIVSTPVFAVMHGFSVVFPVALVLGTVTAMIYHHSGSIWPAVMLHAVNNGIALLSR